LKRAKDEHRRREARGAKDAETETPKALRRRRMVEGISPSPAD